MNNGLGFVDSHSRRESLRWMGGTLLRIPAAAIILPAALVSASAARMPLQRIDGRPPAPDFALPDLDGNIVRFADFRGKVVLVNFWATWCPPCRDEIPSMERAWRRLKDEGVALLAVHVGGDVEKVWAFANEFNVSFPVLVDKSSKVSREWQTVGLPTTFVVDPDGRKALRAIGGREWDHAHTIEEIVGLKGVGNR